MIQEVNNATVEVNACYREDSEYCAVGICLRQMDHCLRKNIQSVTTQLVVSKGLSPCFTCSHCSRSRPGATIYLMQTCGTIR